MGHLVDYSYMYDKEVFFQAIFLPPKVQLHEENHVIFYVELHECSLKILADNNQLKPGFVRAFHTNCFMLQS